MDCNADPPPVPMDHAHEIHTVVPVAVLGSTHASTAPSYPEGHTESRSLIRRTGKAQPGAPNWRTTKNSRPRRRKWRRVDMAFLDEVVSTSMFAGKSAISCRRVRCARL